MGNEKTGDGIDDDGCNDGEGDDKVDEDDVLLEIGLWENGRWYWWMTVVMMVRAMTRLMCCWRLGYEKTGDGIDDENYNDDDSDDKVNEDDDTHTFILNNILRRYS